MTSVQQKNKINKSLVVFMFMLQVNMRPCDYI